DTELISTVPFGATTGKIRVTNGDGTGESSSDFVVIPPPVVWSFSPSIGPPGTEVTVFGSDFSAASGVLFNGTSASSFTVSSDSELLAVVPLGATSGPITVENLAGGSTSGSDFTVTAPPSTMSFQPIGDSYVRSNRASKNYGSKGDLEIEDDATQRQGYLKFDVSGLGGSVQSATLRLVVINAGDDGGGIYTVSNDYSTGGSWTEAGLTWENAPGISGLPLSSTGVVDVGDTVDFDVTGAISGNGVYSFGIKNASKSRMEYSSKEGSHIPELIIEVLTTPVPVIASFVPTSGIVGDSVTISGQNFGGVTAVTFNGFSAAITSNTGSELVVLVPSGATTGRIEVTNADGVGESGSDFTVIQPPVLSNFSPTSGAVGTEVTITGSNLSAVSLLKFNGLASATLDVDSASQLRATVPSGASSGLIELSNAAGSASSASPFTIAQIPVVSSFSPMSGIAGTVVTISGSNFTGTTAVAFGDQSATFVFESDSELTATVPAGATTSRIKITNGDGTGESGSDFVVILAPTISSFSPSSGFPGTEVTILGSHFTDASGVQFNGSAASSFTVDSDTQVRATVAAGASSGKISIENVAGVTESASDFDVTAAPSTLSLAPVHDSYVRSDRAGNNYGGKGDLEIEDDAAQRRGYLKFEVSGLGGSVQSATLRLVVINAGDDGGGIYSVSNDYATGGPWTEGGLTWDNAPAISGTPLSSTGAVSVDDTVEFDLTGVISGNGVYSFGIMNASKSRMEYSSKEGSHIPELIIEVLTSPVPVISSFSPTSGIVGDGVTINGQNFGGTTLVTFNGESASIISNTASELKVTVPSGASTGKIAVKNADGTGQSAGDFTVIVPPMLSGFSPSSGPVGTEVTLSGSNLSHVSEVAFGSTVATDFTIDSDTELRVTVPAGAEDSKISVSSLAGSAEASGQFNVTLPPAAQISSFSPLSGPVGTEVTVSGQNMVGITSVEFGAVAASTFEVDSATQLRATVPSGATTDRIRVTNGGGTGESATDFEVTAPPSILTFTPIADNRVKSSSPDKNYGSKDELRVQLKGGKQNNGYLKFEVTGIGVSVQSAKLRLNVVSASDDGGGIYSVSNNYAGSATPWEESGLTWNNAPGIAGIPLSTLGEVSKGVVVEFDVTSAISGDGVYSFAITNSSDDAVKYSTKEGNVTPELVIETSSSISKRSPLWQDPAEEYSETELVSMPEEISLSPAYPNPFNQRTVIEYGLPELREVQLSVHNVRGQEVRLLVDGEVEGGFQRVIWNGRDNRGNVVGSGVYFVRLIAGRRVFTQVLTLQK
ncbi:DNRLRE domain-containing protein, partial [bacterium]|nr:DNRLRE domain-containing protein [bacterium]